MGVKEIVPISITVQLVNWSLVFLEGQIEDILVKVERFKFLTDFVILEMEGKGDDVSFMFWKEFLATGRTIIDVQAGELTLRVNEARVTISIFKSMKFPNATI